jgi:undecaprenyl-diphosphatase
VLKWLRRGAREVNRIDRDLVQASARIPRSPLDPGLKALTTAANHSVLWLTIAAVLARRKGVTRRAAFRGGLAIAGASVTANAVVKPIAPRRRPAAEDVPTRRTLPDPPESSSFPSGHAASAAAFTTAVALESPLAGAALAPVAAAVAYSRVHTGVHWPSDVAAGMLLGTGIALGTRRWWPVRPDLPAVTRPGAPVAPGLPDGNGLLVLVNTGSGADGVDPGPEVVEALPAARVLHPDAGSDLAEELERAVDDGTRAIGVAGGDGTVTCAATVAAGLGLPLAVIPAGTLNHFARDVGLDGVAHTAEAVQEGCAVTVDLGAVCVDEGLERPFVNTASLGAYPDTVRWRERYEDRWGKWPTAVAAVLMSFRHSTPLTVRIGGRSRRVWMVFVGNGPYHPGGISPAWRPRLDTGLLDVRYLRADLPFSRARFVLSAITGTVERSRAYVQWECPELEVEVEGNTEAVATDGEIGASGRHFRFRSQRAALLVYRPG